jgi:hypothetical protein
VTNHDFSGIQGFDALRAVYGEKVCFHDAEVVRLELVRGRPDTGEVDLVLDVHMFSADGVDPHTRRFRLVNHHIARLVFHGVQDLELTGFNHQNALSDLDVLPLRPARNGAAWSVRLQPAFGLGASFICSGARVQSVTPGAPAASVLTAEGRP